jgi:hypothetical protein
LGASADKSKQDKPKDDSNVPDLVMDRNKGDAFMCALSNISNEASTLEMLKNGKANPE